MLKKLKNTHVLTPGEYDTFSDCLDFFSSETNGAFDKLNPKEQLDLMMENCPFPGCKICEKVKKWIYGAQPANFYFSLIPTSPTPLSLPSRMTRYGDVEKAKGGAPKPGVLEV